MARIVVNAFCCRAELNLRIPFWLDSCFNGNLCNRLEETSLKADNRNIWESVLDPFHERKDVTYFLTVTRQIINTRRVIDVCIHRKITRE